MKLALRVVQRVLFLCAFSAIAYCAFVFGQSWMFQRSERLRFDALLDAQSSATPPPALADGLLGRIEIPRLDLSVMVMEGTGSSALRRAAGHIPGTSMPGQPGNIGISAHRDTFFRPLRNIRHDDVITLATLRGAYRYRVVSTSIVQPDDVTVLDPTPDETLTLVTCYPFYFVGAAPKRFIVHAQRIV